MGLIISVIGSQYKKFEKLLFMELVCASTVLSLYLLMKCSQYTNGGVLLEFSFFIREK